MIGHTSSFEFGYSFVQLNRGEVGFSGQNERKTKQVSLKWNSLTSVIVTKTHCREVSGEFVHIEQKATVR